MSDRIMISMPYHDGTSVGDLKRAVESVGRQTAHGIVLVLIADGCPVLDLGEIARYVSVVHVFGENHGRYFADAVTLRAAAELGIEYWMVHDSDDWTEPEHVESLMKSMRSSTDVVFGGYIRPTVSNPDRRIMFDLVKARRLRHGTQYASVLWRSKSLLRIGGPHPDWRVAWDTMLITIAASYLRYAISNSAKYHYNAHPGSLTQSRETGMNSQIRRTAHHQRREMWQQIRRRVRSIDDVGKIVTDSVRAETRSAVDRESSLLVQSLSKRLNVR